MCFARKLVINPEFGNDLDKKSVHITQRLGGYFTNMVLMRAIKSMTSQRFSKIFRLGIRQKVLLVLVAVLLTALSISGWLALEKEKVSFTEEINQRGTDISRFVSKSLGFSVIGYDYHTIQLLLDEIALSDDVEYAKVTSKKGNVMAESGPMTEPKPDHIVLFLQDIDINNETVGKLELGLSTEKTLARIESQKFLLLTREALIIFLIAIGEFIALSFLIIRPVSIIRNSLDNNVDENGQITGDIPLTSQDEFGQLADQFNHLRSQLNNANLALHSKIEVADRELIKTNKQLVQQSEELKKINKEFKKLSITDPLTGLYNRRHFEDLMATEIAMSVRYGDTNSLLIFDIDHFKRVNDDYGHQGGDIVLRDFSDLLKKCIRKTDILCRIGGEEFVAFCKRSNNESAKDIADKIRQAVAQEQFDLGEHKIYITTSIGIATFPTKNKNSNNDLYKNADVALYYSKRNGRNLATHYDDIPAEKMNTASNQLKQV